MYSRNEILVAEQQIVNADAAGVISLDQPANYTDCGSWAEEATFVLSVVAVRGAPSAWSLGAKFQVLAPSVGSNKFQFTNRRWFDLQPENVDSLVIEGVGWYGAAHAPPVGGEFGIIADQTDALTDPITVQRTIRNFGADVRIRLNPQFTGGTTPSLSLSLVRIPKGHL